jgi:hypothetical protein
MALGRNNIQTDSPPTLPTIKPARFAVSNSRVTKTIAVPIDITIELNSSGSTTASIGTYFSIFYCLCN